ncbi:glutaconate CoA-transferase, subunit B [Patescibacteria group bacterium]|nr:glutaconate CoA-transferase, subunit B [Patescibacteria group bacterium]
MNKCNIAEAMIYQLALSIKDRGLVFHGYGSPLVQVALHLAKRFLTPNMILVAGATYAVNPTPVFLTPTSHDSAMASNAECVLNIEELFDLAASGRMSRMFLSGLQIDSAGNLNVTQLDKLKLPGGGGGGNLSCDAKNITIWTAAHRTDTNKQGKRRYRLVKQCDFITSVGRKADKLITELAVFDFDESRTARLIQLYPDTDINTVKEHTEFEFSISNDLSIVELPNTAMIQFIREFDPLLIHQREFKTQELERHFSY